jgi:predicted transcriptional regulator
VFSHIFLLKKDFKMTIKEIAELTGKTERQIRNWISSDKMSGLSSEKISDLSSEKISDISEKIDEAYKTKKPADFTLDETITILKAGKISEMLINLLKQSATVKNHNSQLIENLTVNKIESVLSDFMSKLIEKISTQNLLESPKETRKDITIQEVLSIVNKSEKSIMTAALMINRDEIGIYTKVHDAIRGKVLYFTYEEISMILTYLKVSPKIIDIFKY